MLVAAPLVTSSPEFHPHLPASREPTAIFALSPLRPPPTAHRRRPPTAAQTGFHWTLVAWRLSCVNTISILTMSSSLGATMKQLLHGPMTTTRFVDRRLLTFVSKPMIGVDLHHQSLCLAKGGSKIWRKKGRLEISCFSGEKRAAVKSEDTHLDLGSGLIQQLATRTEGFIDLPLESEAILHQKMASPAEVMTKDVAKSDISTLPREKVVGTSVTFHRPKTLKKDKDLKYPVVGAPLRNNLDPYDILKYPLATEAAIKLMETNNTLVFVVDIGADKKQIRGAIENMLGIQTRKINTVVRPDGTKKAFVILSPEYVASDVASKVGII